MILERLHVILKRDVLLYVVFFTGAVVLAVEVMAVRILAPFFGNTIFSFSSILSVILAALSVGYWHGGRLADKTPTHEFFYRLVTYAGWAVILAQFAGHFILPVLSGIFSVITGPLVASIILFFIPSYLFGLMSPFAIKLRSIEMTENGIGQVSGAVFFSSTLGSIFGSLLSGFVLIPHIGISISMYSMGVLVVLIGVVGTLRKRTFTWKHFFFYFVLFFAGGVLALNIEKVLASNMHGDVLFMKDGLYERVMVVEKEYMNQHARILELDKGFSSGITYPDGDLLFLYSVYYKLFGFFRESTALHHALVLGAGTGTLAREIHKEFPEATIDIVDVEPMLFTLARQYFLMPETEKIREHTADGRQFLRNSKQQYELIFGDMYSTMYSVPFQTMTKEYYTLLYSRLVHGGVYMGNYIASLDFTPPSLLGSIVSTMHEVFDDVYVFAVDSADSGDAQNFVIVATKGKNLPKLSKETIYRNRDSTYRIFANNLVENVDAIAQGNSIFTDDLAPVELRTGELIKEFSL